MPKPTIFSGIQPTGDLHIGNYLGAVKNWVELQNSGKYNCFFSIVDLHSLTGNLSAEDRREKTIILAAELIAAGIDPKKSTLFVQSHVPGHTELAWIFNCVTPMGELKRMTQFKSKSGVLEVEHDLRAGISDLSVYKHGKEVVKRYRNNPPEEYMTALREAYTAGFFDLREEELKLERKENHASTGLFTYPVLQAADILLYHGTHVPVGEDQVQHVELTRDIARWFNKRFGEYFPETKAILTKTSRVKSLLEPTSKMSKSLGENHAIDLADEPEVIEKKIKKAVTATQGGKNNPGAENLLLLLKEFGDEKMYKQFAAAEKNGSIKYGELKVELSRAIADHFSAFRERRVELLEKHNELADVLAEGAHRANEVAEKTIMKIRKMVGIR